jgi:hypothetical protein
MGIWRSDAHEPGRAYTKPSGWVKHAANTQRGIMISSSESSLGPGARGRRPGGAAVSYYVVNMRSRVAHINCLWSQCGPGTVDHGRRCKVTFCGTFCDQKDFPLRRTFAHLRTRCAVESDGLHHPPRVEMGAASASCSGGAQGLDSAGPLLSL